MPLLTRTLYLGLALAVLPAWLIWVVPQIPLLQPDSSSYVSFSAFRSAGYPVFLGLAQAVGFSLAQVVWLQLAIYWTALCFLGWAVSRATSSRLCAVAAVALVALNIEVNKYSFTILTESLFISTIIAICASIILCIFNYRLRWALALSVFVGAAVSIRPVGYSFVPLLALVALVVVWEYKPKLTAAAMAFALPCLGAIAMETALFAAFHDGPRMSLLGGRLFAKSALVSPQTPNPFDEADPRHRIWDLLQEDAAPVRSLIANAPDFGTSNFLKNNYEVYFEYRFANTPVQSAATALGVSVHDVKRDVGQRRLAEAPLQFAGLVWHDYRGLWTPFAASHPTTAALANAYLRSAGKLPLAEEDDVVNQPIKASRTALVIQPIFLMCWLATILIPVACLAWFWRYRSIGKDWIAASIFSLMVNGNFLLVAIFGVSIPRYTLAMWPPLVLAGGFALVAVWRALRPIRAS